MTYFVLFPAVIVFIFALAKLLTVWFVSGSTAEPESRGEERPVTTAGLKIQCNGSELESKLNLVASVEGLLGEKQRQQLRREIEKSPMYSPGRLQLKTRNRGERLATVFCWTKKPEDIYEIRIETSKEIIRALREALGIPVRDVDF